jgi:tRNA(Arg) A34 adenosine deaminase TadA
MEKNYINLAFQEAIKAKKKWDYPIWAIMIDDNWEIIVWRNERNTKNDKKSHAEINLINKAKNHKISKKIIYVTLEPCEMCTKALIDFWIEEIHYILEDPFKWWLKNIKDENIKIVKHNDNNEYLKLLLDFFPKDVYLEYREYFEKLL